MTELHPFYEARRPQMEAAMRQRLDLADALVREHLNVSDTTNFRQETMDEFEIVLGQMPYVGGEQSRMTDFFMRLLGFMALGRVLRRHGLPAKVIGDIEVETYKAQLLLTPEAERLKAGRQFMSPENKALVREQAASSREQKYSGDFVYDFVEPGPNDRFEFGINYRACGFCKFAAATRTSCPTSVGSILRPMRHAASGSSAPRPWRAERRTAISVSRRCRPRVSPATVAMSVFGLARRLWLAPPATPRAGAREPAPPSPDR